MEFLVLAYDGKDEGAKARRLAARPAHLEGVKELISNGSFVSGGAILDDAGEMIGSTLHLRFPSRADLDRWLENDPYVTGEVWKDVAVFPIRLVPT